MFKNKDKLPISSDECNEFAERHGLTPSYVEYQLRMNNWRTFPSVDMFWGYVIRDENLSRDVVRSVAYEDTDYVNSFDTAESYLLYRLGATTLSSGTVVYTYGTIVLSE